MLNNIRLLYLLILIIIEVISFIDKAVMFVDVYYFFIYISLNVFKWFVFRVNDTVYCVISEGFKFLVIICIFRIWNNIYIRFCGYLRILKLKVIIV